tara:strand:- start:45787 stop:47013 length:1227 start_codon:yes stop_codon:yes gene_type:complete
MISYKEAQVIIREAANARKIDTETVALKDIAGRVCAQDITTPLDVQPFDNSAMDGFAVLVSDLAEASISTPVTLKSTGITGAGSNIPDQPITSGTCIQIMTGAPIPPKADAVIPVELATVNNKEIVFTSCPETRDNIRFAGEDFKKGTSLIKAGKAFDASHILPLATLGIEKIQVYKKPEAAFLSTGTELVDDLTAPLKYGQIYNSNHPYAVAMLRAMGANVLSLPTIKDDIEIFKKQLVSVMDHNKDIVISSGAVSAGNFDFVKSGLEAIGAEILYHKVRLKPGKPNLLARLPNGTLYFGLPGNPVATAVGLRFFAGTALQIMSGMKAEQPIQAKIMTKFTKKPGMTMYLKGKMESWEDGSLTVDMLDGQASFMVSPFLDMNVWISIPEDKDTYKPGDVVDVFPIVP